MKCSTGKRIYDSEVQAVDALVDIRSRNNYPPNSGPINVYKCEDCSGWHFTSRPPQHKILDRPDIQKKIQSDSEAAYWERKLRF